MKDKVKLVYPNTGKETELYYSPYANPHVVRWIEQCLHTDKRVRLFFGDTERADFIAVHGRDPEPGLDWGEEHDVTGYIGCSMGPVKIPILIANRRSLGGGSILDDCIVRMFVDGREVYRHPNYHSEFESAEVVESELAPEYSHAILTNQGEIVRFHSEKSAKNWLAFMRGERMSK